MLLYAFLRSPTRLAPTLPLLRRLCCLIIATIALQAPASATSAVESNETEFGKDIALAPFQVNGAPLSVSIHARSNSDRRYAENFADEVVDIAYHTVGEFSGEGLVIVGRKGEPHPIHVYRKFIALAQEGVLDPTVLPSASELEAVLAKLEGRFKVKNDEEQPIEMSFDTFIPALPLPLEGVASAIYQIAWSEGFDPVKMDAKFRTLTRGDLVRGELGKYDWVFYLPPRSASGPVLKELINKAMAAHKMGLMKRAAMRSALFVMSPAVKKAVEGFRKGMLYMAILRAESPLSEDDVEALTATYVQAIMPDFKPGSKDRAEILAAIEKQKAANAEYARDPFKAPPRLQNFDPKRYSSYVGEYTNEPPTTTHWFKQDGAAFYWNYKTRKPRAFYPAGERIFVNEDNSMTIEFLVGEDGVVTGVEERWVRRRQIIPKSTATANAPSPRAETAAARRQSKDPR